MDEYIQQLKDFVYENRKGLIVGAAIVIVARALFK
jgi:hypothetical protein